MENTKKCKICEEIKSNNNFRKCYKKLNSGTENEYFGNICKKCIADNRKLKYSIEREQGKSRRILNIERALWEGCKKRAKMKNLEFDIEISDIIIPEICPFLEIPIKIGKSKAWDYSPSVDRIDNSKGYVKGNVQIISRMANIMKAHASKEQLLLFAKNINNYYQAQNKLCELLEN